VSTNSSTTMTTGTALANAAAEQSSHSVHAVETLPIPQSPAAPHPSLSYQVTSYSISDSSTPEATSQPVMAPSTAANTAIAASTAEPSSSVQTACTLNANINSVSQQGFNAQTVCLLLLTILGVAWTIKSVQEASLINKLARAEVCRVHPVSPHERWHSNRQYNANVSSCFDVSQHAKLQLVRQGSNRSEPWSSYSRQDLLLSLRIFFLNGALLTQQDPAFVYLR
jgi:hypothetical protein